jgi:ASC-1-like (ASCH) protein
VRHHLAVIHDQYLTALLEGRKRIECRLSSVRKPPFEQAAAGDLVWFKQPSGPVRAVGCVGAYEFVRVSGEADVARIAREHGKDIQAPAAFWKNTDWARYVSLLWMEWTMTVTPFAVDKRDQLAWVVLTAPPRPGQSILRVRTIERARIRASGVGRRHGRVPDQRS